MYLVKTTLLSAILPTARANIRLCDSQDDCPVKTLCYSHIQLCDDSIDQCIGPWESTLADLDHRLIPRAIKNGFNSIVYFSHDVPNGNFSPQSCHPEAESDERCFLTTSCHSPKVCKRVPSDGLAESEWFCDLMKCESDNACGDTQKCLHVSFCDEKWQSCDSNSPSAVINIDYESHGTEQRYCLDLVENVEDGGVSRGCDELHACANGGYCQDGACQTVCKVNENCDTGEECIFNVQYCNSDYNSCDHEMGTKVNIKYTNTGSDGDEGLCYKSVENGETCNANVACKSGQCKNGACANYCDDTHNSCTGHQQCLDEILYCNETYDSCSVVQAEGWSTEQNTVLYNSGPSGSCYELASSIDACNELVSCASGYCDNNKHCLNEPCKSTGDCPGSKVCVTYENCDSTYTNCTIKEGTDKVTINYIEITDSATWGQCVPELEVDKRCDYTTSCESGWCGSSGKCEFECHKDHRCSGDDKCISSVLYCNMPGEIEYGDCQETPPTDGLYSILYTNANFEDDDGGTCMHQNDEYEPCDGERKGCVSSLCGQKKECNVMCYGSNSDCKPTPDGLDGKCIAKLEYCDANYLNCNLKTWYGFSTITYDEYDVDEDGYGTCMPVVDKGGCHEFVVCESGFCSSGMCQTTCDGQYQCADNELCFTDVVYCNTDYTECSEDRNDDLVNLKYQFKDGMSGKCYHAGAYGDICDAVYGCSTGYCEFGFCAHYAVPCERESECPKGEKCLFAVECNSNYANCVALDTSDSNTTIHYEYAGLEGSGLTGQAYCRILQDNDKHCDEWQFACMSGWCNESETCENYCEGITDCNNGFECHSKVEYCDLDGNCSEAPEDGKDTIHYEMGGPGICLARQEDGESCDDTENSCKSGYCHTSGHCATKCNVVDNDCDKNEERCINKIEYCADFINDEWVDCQEEVSEDYAINYHPAGSGGYGDDGFCVNQGSSGQNCDGWYWGCYEGICNQLGNSSLCVMSE